MSATREQIMSALFGLVSSVPGFVTASRRIRLYNAVSSAEKPALYMMQTGTRYVRQSANTPHKRTFEVRLVIYTDAGTDPNVVAATTLNGLVDAVEAALQPTGADLMSGRQTLGGLVDHCFIDGQVTEDDGALDGQGLAVIPITILGP